MRAERIQRPPDRANRLSRPNPTRTVRSIRCKHFTAARQTIRTSRFARRPRHVSLVAIPFPGALIVADIDAVFTTGAPLRDAPIEGKAFPEVKPYNVISVYGERGRAIDANAQGGAKFLEGNPSDPTHVGNYQLDENGRADLHLYFDYTDGHSRRIANLDSATVTVGYSNDLGDQTKPLQPVFSPYQRESTNTVILGFANTSEAPANGDSTMPTPCTVYVCVDTAMYKNVTSVRFAITNAEQGKVWIDDGSGQKPTWIDSPLAQGTSSTSVDILSNTAQKAWTVEISTQAPFDSAHVTVKFVEPPATPHR
ncbi:hypothetical protein [Burkholderia dolosa]|uniref:hypothetical protein n=1 Tax=Burkholderia dolosa TaxID=152500 RepID=UPI001B904547|nr:hypothetical protein [Burkholderia dolosa]MBR8058417.1 hypothetical protein [Burkholderia dolosa]